MIESKKDKVLEGPLPTIRQLTAAMQWFNDLGDAQGLHIHGHGARQFVSCADIALFYAFYFPKTAGKLK